MATSTPTGRIGGLVDKVGPLAGKRRGMRIEADEWNTLVDVVSGLLELERLQETSLQDEFKDEFAPKNHHHVGDIGIDSLDPELQSRLASNGGGVSTRIALVDLQARVTTLTGDVGRASAQTEDLQRRLDRATADDVEQGSRVRKLEDGFGGIEGLRGLVTGLSTQVADLHEGIQAVLDLRASLGDVDVGGLRDRVSSLELVAKNFEGADGNPVRLRDVELQIGELQDVLDIKGAGSGLDDRFNGLRDALATELDGRIDDGLAAGHATLQTELADSRASMTAELDGKVADARSELATSLDAKIAESQTALDASLASRVDAAAGELRTTLSDETKTLVETRLADLPATVQTAVTSAVSAATPGLREEVLATLGATLDTRLADAAAQLASRADALEARFDEQANAVPSLVSAQANALLPELVDERMAAASESLATSLGARVDQQLAQARDGLAATLQEQVAATVTGAVGDLDGRIGTQLDSRLADLPQRIDAAAREAVADLPTRVAGEVQTQLAALDLDGRFTKLADELTASFQSSLEASVAKVQEQHKADLAAATEALRGEIGAARDAALHEALDRIDATTAELKQGLVDEAKRADTALDGTAGKVREELKTGLGGLSDQLTGQTKQWIGEAVQQVGADISKVRDSVTADFEAQLEKMQSTLISRIDAAAKTTLGRAQTLVTNLQNAVTPRLDKLEAAVFHQPTGAQPGGARRTARPG